MLLGERTVRTNRTPSEWSTCPRGLHNSRPRGLDTRLKRIVPDAEVGERIVIVRYGREVHALA